MKPPSPTRPRRWRALGSGNPLRGDNGAGPCLADRVAAGNLPGITALALPRLVPEPAARLAGGDGAVFADAATGSHRPVLRPLRPRERAVLCGHGGDPAGLRALTRLVFGSAPRAWWLRLPAREFGLGQDLSATARGGLEAATVPLRRLLGARGSV